MRDGFTEKLKTAPRRVTMPDFLAHYEPKLVLVSGHAAGTQWQIDQEHVTLGRGPGVDIAVDDAAMSRQHAAIDFADGRFRIRDLGSTNGLIVNGNRVQACELEHGDQVEIGGCVFQLVIDERESTPDTYDLTSEV